MNDKISVLFLCTGNSCRSQMAEGLCRHLLSDILQPFSAGIESRGLDPLACKVMKEIGIDISGQKSKTMESLGNREFDYVITLCSHADSTCPVFPARTKKVHQGFDDPPKLALNAATEEYALVHYRRVREEIRDFLLTLPRMLDKTAPSIST